MGGSFISDETTNQRSRKAPNMETIAITAIMAILAACTAAGLVGNDNDAMEARR
jgi:hypothetical protein